MGTVCVNAGSFVIQGFELFCCMIAVLGLEALLHCFSRRFMDLWSVDWVQPLESVIRVTIFGGDRPCFVILAKPELLISNEVKEIFGSGARSLIAEVAIVFHVSATLFFFRLTTHLATRFTTILSSATIKKFRSLNIINSATPICASQKLGPN